MSDILRPWSAVFLLAMVALAGCATPAEPESSRAWHGEARAHGDMGTPAEFSFITSDYLVTGSGALQDLQAPVGLGIAPTFPDDLHLVYLDATLSDGREGLLMLETAPDADLRLTQGSLSQATVQAVAPQEDQMSLQLDDPLEDPIGGRYEKPEVTFPDELQDEGRVYFHADEARLSIQGGRIETAERALLVTDNASAELTLPVTFDAAGIIWDRDSSLLLDGTASLVYERFAMAGLFQDGTFEAEGVTTDPLPDSLVGQQATLELSGQHAASDGRFRLVQASQGGAFLMDAAVEVAPVDEHITIAQGETEWLQVAYREHSYFGAAVFSDLKVTGSGADHVEVPLGLPPFFIEEMIELLDDAHPVAQAMWTLGVVLASPALIFADLFRVIGCALSFCPDQHPYPTWIDPGDVNDFYYKIDATNAPPGDYEATITVEGANHDAVSWSIAFTVE